MAAAVAGAGGAGTRGRVAVRSWRWRWLCGLGSLLAAVLACAPASLVAGGPSGPGAGRGSVSGEVVVFAASSLTDAFQEIATAFQHANPDARVAFNFGASSQLATQLAQGARADVFASADQAQMDRARQADALAGEDRVFAHNRLVLITPRDNPGGITALSDLARPGIKVVTVQPAVPIGRYTTEMLRKAATNPAYGADFTARVQANTVSQEDNVRQVVSKVQLGEADAAVVYSTDATPQVRDQLKLIPIPDTLQTLASYPIAVTRTANTAAAQAFVSYVLDPDGQAILTRWGFLPPATTISGAPAAAGAPRLTPSERARAHPARMAWR